jgi:hypothetical protein
LVQKALAFVEELSNGSSGVPRALVGAGVAMVNRCKDGGADSSIGVE